MYFVHYYLTNTYLTIISYHLPKVIYTELDSLYCGKKYGKYVKAWTHTTESISPPWTLDLSLDQWNRVYVEKKLILLCSLFHILSGYNIKEFLRH